jgi:hypothetical protein
MNMNKEAVMHLVAFNIHPGLLSDVCFAFSSSISRLIEKIRREVVRNFYLLMSDSREKIPKKKFSKVYINIGGSLEWPQMGIDKILFHRSLHQSCSS